ncbi:hypothetical protein VTK73DRAFT_3128 [Phialemonium thermophilum]|uniref:Ig-like domain-containing protein n=1 Tax=Phialemonium thermophilum TaxID=223376 RepID=A0ABR3VL35_9PEZI
MAVSMELVIDSRSAVASRAAMFPRYAPDKAPRSGVGCRMATLLSDTLRTIAGCATAAAAALGATDARRGLGRRTVVAAVVAVDVPGAADVASPVGFASGRKARLGCRASGLGLPRKSELAWASSSRPGCWELLGPGRSLASRGAATAACDGGERDEAKTAAEGSGEKEVGEWGRVDPGWAIISLVKLRSYSAACVEAAAEGGNDGWLGSLESAVLLFSMVPWPAKLAGSPGSGACGCDADGPAACLLPFVLVFPLRPDCSPAPSRSRSMSWTSMDSGVYVCSLSSRKGVGVDEKTVGSVGEAVVGEAVDRVSSNAPRS